MQSVNDEDWEAFSLSHGIYNKSSLAALCSGSEFNGGFKNTECVKESRNILQSFFKCARAHILILPEPITMNLFARQILRNNYFFQRFENSNS